MRGRGSTPSSSAIPPTPQNLLRSSGRGVFYMRSFMDEVSFCPSDQGGTRIELTKNLADKEGSMKSIVRDVGEVRVLDLEGKITIGTGDVQLRQLVEDVAHGRARTRSCSTSRA